MRWTVAVLLRPATFVLAIVAAVITGNRTDSFWFGLLAFFVAMGAGRVLGAIVRGRLRPPGPQGGVAGGRDRLCVPVRRPRAAALGELLRLRDRCVPDANG